MLLFLGFYKKKKKEKPALKEARLSCFSIYSHVNIVAEEAIAFTFSDINMECLNALTDVK